MVKGKNLGSTPIFSTTYDADNEHFASIIGGKEPISDKKATRFVKAEPKQVYPFEPPRLIIPYPESKDQRWHIRMKVWDSDQGKLVPLDDYESLSGEFSSPKKKLKYAEMLRDDYLARLEAGEHIHASKRRHEENQQKIKQRAYLVPVCDALFHAIETKRNNKVKIVRDSTVNHYKSTLSSFKRWINNTPYASFSAHDIQSDHIQEYLQWLGECGGRPDEHGNITGASLKTINGHRTDLKTLFGGIKMNHNPCDEIEYSSAPDKKNEPYSADQKKVLIDFMKEHEPDILFGVIFMYHCMCRTNEMAHIQFKHIGMYVPNKIYLPQEFSKSKYERHIVIHPELMDILYEMKSKYDPEWYLFSYGFKPGMKCCGSAKLGVCYRKKVLVPCGFDWKKYKFYSWRGTANVDTLDTPGLPISFAYEQGGWKTMSAFQKYCKSFGREGREINIDQKPYLIQQQNG